MASLKEVKNRINSVKSTRQITSAMKMVASAKLHKAQNRIGNMLPYQQMLNRILTNFLGTDMAIESAFTEVRPVTRVAIVPFSSNSSLCGAFNSNVARLLEKTVSEYSSIGRENIVFYPVGKKIEESVKKLGFSFEKSYQAMADKPSYAESCLLAQKLMQDFLEQRIDVVQLIYHHFKSTGSQVLVREEFLPIDLEKIRKEALSKAVSANSSVYNNDYIIEPSAKQIIIDLLPKVLCQKIYTVLLDSNASEHAARTMAMQTATDNANDLIQDLTKQYNKSRQQAITNELLDIIGGSMK